MVGLFRADLFKLRKRAMGWVMLVIIALFVPLQMLPTAFLAPEKTNYSFPGSLLAGVAPVPFVGILIMTILGATLIGTEYGYDTWKNLLTRHPGRVPFILSKWLMLVVAIVIGLIVLLPLGMVTGLVLQSTLHLTGPAVQLSLGSVLLLVVLQTLVPLVAGSIAMMGAVIGRSSVAGIILGIVWFLVDALLGSFVPIVSLSSSIAVLQAQVTGVAASANGSVSSVQLGSALSGPLGIVPGLLVLAYLVVPVAVAAYLFRRRDMLGVG
jgi:ABC-2 type transport system permease protein